MPEVSVTTIDRGARSNGPSQGRAAELGGPAEFDRTPPQDVTAEQGVLGGMLLSKDAIADVVEILRITDFYRPAHATVYEVATELYSKGEPADTVSVAAELHRAGCSTSIGGAPYLHTLIESVPTAANAGYYAKIVAEKAVRRRLVEAGMRVTQLGYNESFRGRRCRRPGAGRGVRRHRAAYRRRLHAARGADQSHARRDRVDR